MAKQAFVKSFVRSSSHLEMAGVSRGRIAMDWLSLYPKLSRLQADVCRMIVCLGAVARRTSGFKGPNYFSQHAKTVHLVILKLQKASLAATVVQADNFSAADTF